MSKVGKCLDYRMHEKDTASMQPTPNENLLMVILWLWLNSDVKLHSCVGLWANIC